MSEHKSWCALYQSDPAAGKSCDCGVAEEAEQSERDTDQLAWDRFAAAALSGLVCIVPALASLASDVAHIADAMMLERAQRLAGKPGEGK